MLSRRRSKPVLTFMLLYIIMNLVLLYHINNGNWIHVCEHQSAYVPRGGSRTSTAGGGAQVTNEAEVTEARSAERVGEGVTPCHRWGSGGSAPENFEKFASKWCILNAFWGNQFTFLTMKLYMKKEEEMRFTTCTYKLIILFFFKISRNSHQNGAFWPHFEVLISILNLQFYD